MLFFCAKIKKDLALIFLLSIPHREVKSEFQNVLQIPLKVLISLTNVLRHYLTVYFCLCRKCAMIAAHYGFSNVFDNLIISLCKFTTLSNEVRLHDNELQFD